MNIAHYIPLLAGLLLAPLLAGVINRVKAKFAGRNGPPLLQLYRDIYKLLRKGAVYSQTTSWVFRAGPVVSIAAVCVSLVVVPMAGKPALLTCAGDFIVLAYVLGLMRFLTVLAAMDTGSAFEGMGSSREVWFSALAEPALLLALAAVARQTHCFSLSDMYAGLSSSWMSSGAALALVVVALFVVLLVENARIPIDDPNTHLELTMIHEVMVLDHSGPDLALIEYASALKLWVLGSLVIGLVLPLRTHYWWVDLAIFCGGMLTLAVLIGVIESIMARLRLLHVPHLIVGAAALALVAVILI